MEVEEDRVGAGTGDDCDSRGPSDAGRNIQIRSYNKSEHAYKKSNGRRAKIFSHKTS